MKEGDLDMRSNGPDRRRQYRSRRELEPLQRLFVVAACVAVAMWLPLVMDWHGSVHAMDWLRLGIGAVGLVAVLVAAVLQSRRP